MFVAKFVHFCSLPVIVVVVVVVVVVVLVVVVVVGWYLFIDVSGQPKGNCSTHETWDGWAVSQFVNQLPIFVAQRPRRWTSDIACLLRSAWITVIFDKLSAVQVAKNSPCFFIIARY